MEFGVNLDPEFLALGPIWDYIYKSLGLEGLLLYTFLLLILLAAPIYVMAKYDGDWSSFFWYLVNWIIIGIGFAFFVIPGVLLWFYYAKRAGWIQAGLIFGGAFGWAVGSSFGYESDGLLT